MESGWDLSLPLNLDLVGTWLDWQAAATGRFTDGRCGSAALYCVVTETAGGTTGGGPATSASTGSQVRTQQLQV